MNREMRLWPQVDKQRSRRWPRLEQAAAMGDNTSVTASGGMAIMGGAVMQENPERVTITSRRQNHHRNPGR